MVYLSAVSATTQINANLCSFSSSQLFEKYFPFCFLMKVESKMCELAFCLAVSTLFSLFKLNISFNCWIRSSIQPLEFSNSQNPAHKMSVFPQFVVKFNYFRHIQQQNVWCKCQVSVLSSFRQEVHVYKVPQTQQNYSKQFSRFSS